MQQRLPIGREVTLEIKTTDHYGRSVAEVISEININLAMVEDGQAFAYRQYLDGCDAKEVLDAEYRASRRRYGVWQVPGGITRPWDFRRGRSSTVIPDGTTGVVTATAVGRSAPMPAPRNCCARGTPISMATAMRKPVNHCAHWVSAGTGTGTPAGHRQLKRGVL
ncbi:thermonuclease family protein [Synechococcus sp. FGCU-3]|nr:thermonuclease family protein [Synechococcus sp. FGCU3]